MSSRVLRLDFDKKRLTTADIDRVVVALRFCRVRPVYFRLDRTRRGWHVVVVLVRRLPAMATVALQAIAGSDWKREAFNFGRARVWSQLPEFWKTRWNVLYHVHYRGRSGTMGRENKGNPLGPADVQRTKSGVQFIGLRKQGQLELLNVRRGSAMPLGWIARASGKTYEGLRVYCLRNDIAAVKPVAGRLGVPFGVGVKMLDRYDAFKLKLATKAMPKKKVKRSAKKK